jgi:hypothetical protein
MNDGEHFVIEVFTKYIPENKKIRDMSKMLGHTSGVSYIHINKKKIHIDKCLENVFYFLSNNVLTSVL